MRRKNNNLISFICLGKVRLTWDSPFDIQNKDKALEGHRSYFHIYIYIVLY